jgi:hypothetical protein
MRLVNGQKVSLEVNIGSLGWFFHMLQLISTFGSIGADQPKIVVFF